MNMAKLNALTLALSISTDLEANDTNAISLFIFERRRVINQWRFYHLMKCSLRYYNNKQEVYNLKIMKNK